MVLFSVNIRFKFIFFITFFILFLGTIVSIEAKADLCIVCHKESEISEHSYCKRWMKDGHPVFVKPSSKVEVPAMFPLNEQGELTCETCHIPESAPSVFEDKQEVYTGKFTLRYSNKESFLCKKCHVKKYNKKPEGERRNHPINLVMDKIPRELLEAGAVSTKNQILCQTCHKIHLAKGDPLLIMPEGNSKLCGNCHPDYFAFNREGAARKGTHPVDIIPVTASITQTIANLGGKRGGPKKIICLTCHRAHNAPQERALLIGDRKEICKVCHEKHPSTITGTKHDLRLSAPNSTNIKGRKAKDEQVCSPCHLAHGGKGPKMWGRELSGEGDIMSQLCESCHQKGKNKIAKIFTGEFSHLVGVENIFRLGRTKLPLYNEYGLLSANKNVTCATCHNVHQWDPLQENRKGVSRNGTKANSFLRLKNMNSELCKACHSTSFSIKGTSHDPANENFRPLVGKRKKGEDICEGCHVVHNAKSVRLWKFDPGDGNDLISQVCNTCHESEGIAQNKTIGRYSHPVDASIIKISHSLESKLPLFSSDLRRAAKGNVYCNTCHDIHRGPTQKQKKSGKKTQNHNYLRKYGDRPDKLCTMCHKGEKLIKNTKHDLSSVVSSSSTEKNQGLCAACHKVHNAKSGLSLWYKPITVVEGEYLSSQMCNQCHTKEGIAKSSVLEGHSHPVGFQVPRRMGKKLALPLYDEQLKKIRRGDILCPTCHDVHQWAPGKKEEQVTSKKGNYLDSFLRIVDEKGVELCLECHPQKRVLLESEHDLVYNYPDEKNWVGQSVKDGGVCSACHLVHRAPQDFSLWARNLGEGPDKVSKLCGSCHADGFCAEDRKIGSNSHPINVPVKSFLNPSLPLFKTGGERDEKKDKVTCASCHDMHMSENKYFLRVSNQDAALCKECHPEKAGIAQSSHDLSKNDSERLCSSCHKVHDSPQQLNLWAKNLDGIKIPKEWFKNPKSQQNVQNKLCLSCHSLSEKTNFNFYHPDNLFFPQLEIQQADQYKDKPYFLYQYGEIKLPVFVGALNSGVRPRYPVFNQEGSVAPVGGIVCPTCHDIHQNNTSDLGKKGLLREKIHKRFCSICHSKDAIYRYQYFHTHSLKKKSGSSGPHFNKEKCLDCHLTKPNDASNAQILFEGDVVKLCESCHDGKKAAREWHKVGMEVSETSLPLKEKKVICITCHDIKSEHFTPDLQDTNPNFLYENDSKPMMTYTWTLKESPIYVQNRYNLCYKCHDEKQYRQFSPHKRQINRNEGTVNKAMCLLCHSRVPRRKTDKVDNFHLRFENTSFCTGCHPGKTETDHPLEKNHYNLKVTLKTGTNIRRVEKREKLFIPVVNERISCFSCHNTHEKGVLRNSFTRKGESAKGRLRFGELDPCSICHARIYRIPSLQEGGFSPW
jgi:predicted CXXCH cytochrome family protein